MTQLPNGNVLVRLGSHRANHKLQRLIGKTRNWYSMKHGGYLAECPEDMLEQARAIAGISIARINRDEWHPCWKVI